MDMRHWLERWVILLSKDGENTKAQVKREMEAALGGVPLIVKPLPEQIGKVKKRDERRRK